MTWRSLGLKIETAFNRWYDLVAKVVKLGLFLLAVLLLFWRWPYIDWGRTSDGLVAKNTPFQFQNEPSAPPPDPIPSNATVPSANPNQTPPPASQRTEVPPQRPPAPVADYLSIYQFGQLVFSVDKPYEITKDNLIFDKLLLKGKPDYSSSFVYAGAEIRITHIEEYIGLLVSGGAVEGPVLRRVSAQMIRK